MLLHVPPHTKIRDLSRRLSRGGLEIVITSKGLELRCRPEPERLALAELQRRQKAAGEVV